MFHVVGITPEAPTLEAATGGRAPARVVDVGPAEIRRVVESLTSAVDGPLGAVSLGTPHFSFEEFRRLRTRLAGRQVAAGLDLFVSTGRDVLRQVEAEGWAEELRQCGVRVVTDTCTYIAPILRPRPGAVMTNSGKWAWYAPGNLGYQVVFGSLDECVESAVRGCVWRDGALWEGLDA